MFEPEEFALMQKAREQLEAFCSHIEPEHRAEYLLKEFLKLGEALNDGGQNELQ